MVSPSWMTRSVDALPLEANIDLQYFQLPNGLKAVLGISGKAGDRFNKDLVDQAPAAVSHHAVEIIPLGSRCSGNAFVGVDTDELPFCFAGDQSRVVLVLRRKGVQLIV